MAKLTKKQVDKQEAEALAERMKRTQTNYVTVPFKSDEFTLGNLRKILTEYSDRFDEDATVHIDDRYSSERVSSVYSSNLIYGYAQPRYILTIRTSKEI